MIGGVSQSTLIFGSSLGLASSCCPTEASWGRVKPSAGRCKRPLRFGVLVLWENLFLRDASLNCLEVKLFLEGCTFWRGEMTVMVRYLRYSPPLLLLRMARAIFWSLGAIQLFLTEIFRCGSREKCELRTEFWRPQEAKPRINNEMRFVESAWFHVSFLVDQLLWRFWLSKLQLMMF